jgi:hypothetical protein
MTRVLVGVLISGIPREAACIQKSADSVSLE